MFEAFNSVETWVALTANVAVVAANYAVLTHRVRALERRLDNGLLAQVRGLGERLAHIEGMLAARGRNDQ